MADLHYREKLRIIEKAASSNEVPDKAKNIGMGCFALGTLLFIGIIICLAITLFVNGIIVGSILTFIVATFFIFILYKLWVAPQFP